jgi:hypothetical protein
MDTQPPQDPRTMTWVDQQNRYWRVEGAARPLAAHPVFAADRDVGLDRRLLEQVRGDRRRTGGAAGGVTFAEVE